LVHAEFAVLGPSLSGKIKFAIATCVLSAAVVVVPIYSLYRYTTTFNDSYSMQDVQNAYGSSETRKQLLQEAFQRLFNTRSLGSALGFVRRQPRGIAERQGKSGVVAPVP
jgi:hypothetical protein